MTKPTGRSKGCGRRILTQDGILELAVLYKSGASYADIQKETGVKPTSVRYLLSSFGVSARWHKLNDADVKQIAAEYQAGDLLGDIAARRGLGGETAVLKALHRAGVQPNRHDKYKFIRVGIEFTSPRDYALFKRFGIRQTDYDRILAEQNGVCAVCGLAETSLDSKHNPKPLGVDHDHATGAVRGLLCTKCNSMLGCALDDPDMLCKGAEYLDRNAVGSEMSS